MSKSNLTNRIEVQTPYGILFAEITGDSNYPGIYVCIQQENAVDGKYERQLALVECTPDIPENGEHTLRLLAWRKDENEDYTDTVTYEGLCKINETTTKG